MDKNNERFEGRGDGDGLYMSYRETFAVPVWRFRYKLKGATRWVTMGSYSDLSVAEARRQAKELRARVALGYDVSAEKQERKAEAIGKIEAKKNAFTAGQLADEYFTKNILGRWNHENTLNVALSKVKVSMQCVEPFTIHDLRRTARTHLAALGIDSHIAERCLNHKIKGVEGIYNRHDYFDERKAALQKLANFLEACELGKAWNVTPIKKAV